MSLKNYYTGKELPVQHCMTWLEVVMELWVEALSLQSIQMGIYHSAGDTETHRETGRELISLIPISCIAGIIPFHLQFCSEAQKMIQLLIIFSASPNILKTDLSQSGLMEIMELMFLFSHRAVLTKDICPEQIFAMECGTQS